MHGSLINTIAANGSRIEPQVGMGATIVMWTDRHAATIVGMTKSRKTIYVQRDRATRVDNRGMSDSQDYEYSADPDAPISTFTLRSNGRWILRGNSLNDGTALLIGRRDEHYDYSF